MPLFGLLFGLVALDDGAAAAVLHVAGLPVDEQRERHAQHDDRADEQDVGELVRVAVSSGKKAAFPLCIENGGLKLLIPESLDSFTVGAYGILEPDPDKSTEISPKELDLIIVPAVAYTECCARLGQGGGYYDRLLAKTDACSVGVGFDFQLLPSLPTESHDRPLDYVVLPSNVFKHAE